MGRTCTWHLWQPRVPSDQLQKRQRCKERLLVGHIVLPREGKDRFVLPIPRMRSCRNPSTQDLKPQMEQRVRAIGCASTSACSAASGQTSSQGQTEPIKGGTGRTLCPGISWNLLSPCLFSFLPYQICVGMLLALVFSEYILKHKRCHEWMWGVFNQRIPSEINGRMCCLPAWGSQYQFC